MAPPTQTAAARPELPRWRKALWALLCVVVVLGAAEVLLRMMSRGMPALVDPASVAVLGERHLIAAGDSVTWGFPAGRDHSYPAYIDAALDAQGVDISVDNTGRPGADYDTIAELLEPVLQRSMVPAAVVLLAGHNDCGLPAESSLGGEAVSERMTSISQRLEQSRLYGLLIQVVHRGHRSLRTERQLARISAQQVEDCRTRIEAGTADIYALATSHKATMFLATYPVHMTRAQTEPGMPDAATVLLNGIIREASQRLDLPLIDTAPCIWSNLSGVDVFEGYAGVHMSAAGYEIMGRCMLSDPALLAWLSSE